MKALRDDIIVKKHKSKERASFLIIIPELKGHYNSYVASEICEIVSVGPKYNQRYQDGKSLRAGDFVLCEHLEGQRIEHDREEYWLMIAKHVQAKISKDYIGRISAKARDLTEAEWQTALKDYQRRGGTVGSM